MLKKIFNEDNYSKNIFIAGILLSVLWVLIINTQPFSDFDYYHSIATNVATGLPWGDTYTSIGYSILLGFFYKIFGISIAVAKGLNIVLTATSFILSYKILCKLSISEKEKRIIFSIFVLMPYNIAYNSLLATEVIFTMLLLLCTYLYLTDYKYKYILIGIIVGLNTMVKPFFIVYFFAIFIVDLFISKSFLKSFKDSLIILICSIIVIAPWIYRNTKLIGEFTYVSNNSGIVLYINNNSKNNSGRWMAAAEVENSIVKTEEYKKANMTEKNKMLSKAAKNWIKEHPKEFTVLGFKRLSNTYRLGDDITYTFNGTTLSDRTKSNIYNYTKIYRKIIFDSAISCILLYSFYILYKILKRNTEELNVFQLYSTVIFYMFTSIYFVTEGQGRYAFPLIFIFCYNAFLLFSKVKDFINNIRRV